MCELGGDPGGAGFLRRDNDGYKASPRSDLWFVGLSYPVGPWTRKFRAWLHEAAERVAVPA